MMAASTVILPITAPSQGWRIWSVTPTPSDADIREADGSGVPWFVISEEAVYVVGPDSRLGGFTGTPGYPI